MLSITVDNRRGILNKNRKQTITENRALVCFLNEDNGEYKIIKEDVLPDNLIDTDKYKPFGCYIFSESIYVGNHDKVIKLDKEGNYISNITLEGFKNPHEILINENVACYTNTGKDEIYLKNKNGNYLIDLKNLPKSLNDINQDDTHHVNSLCYHDDKIFFCLHNRGTKPSQYYYIDLKTNEIHYICEYGMSSHNCEIEGDFLYTLSTNTGCFACINWKTGKGWETKLVDRKDYFLRGLVVTKNHFIIGASLSGNDMGNSEILIIDRETKEIVNKYYIEGYNSIRVIKKI